MESSASEGEVVVEESEVLAAKGSTVNVTSAGSPPKRLPGSDRGDAGTGVSQTFLWAMASGVLVWTAFPPLNLWPIAWLAPLFWIQLIRRPELTGRRPYRALYLAGFIHWLIMVQWIRLPHWSASFGWLALSLYLAVYIPLFVGLSRVAVHQLRLPVVFVAPVVWTGLEFFRGYCFTGFSLALLGHSQVSWTRLIQIADVFGAYGVSFVVMLVAVGIAELFPCPGQPKVRWPVALAIAVVGSVLLYGSMRLHGTTSPSPSSAHLRVALIQGSVDTEFGENGTDAVEAFRQYFELSRNFLGQTEDVGLVVWPESMFTAESPLVTFDESELQPPAESEISAQKYLEILDLRAKAAHHKMTGTAERLGTPMLVGTGAVHVQRDSFQQFNSAVLFDHTGEIVDRYDKMHPVMFGEYIPLGRWIPWLYHLTPLSGGLTAGRQPVAIQVGGLRLSPSICFENTVPHLIRRQIRRLAIAGQSPDVLVTVTNDGWFWGSSLLDLHLTCGVFRAVESRRPMLIAANTGFSAWIDDDGRIREKGPRRATGVVTANVHATRRGSLYMVGGDWAAGICLVFCGVVAGLALLGRPRGKPP